MKDMKFAEIIAANRDLGGSMHGEPMGVKVLSNVIVQPVKDVLEYALRSTGVFVNVTLGDYDQIVQESAGVNARVVMVIWEAANAAEGLPHRLELMETAEREALFRHVASEITLVARNLSQVPLLLWTEFSAFPFTAGYANATAYDDFVDRCNAHLRDALPQNGRLINVDKIYARASLESALDWRGWYNASALYAVPFYKELATSVKPWFDSLAGRTAKLLLMDCDNTLWGGILGEDTPSGVQLDPHQYPGSVFDEIQQRAKALGKRGVLLGLCSKNNAEDVDAMLRDHPWMVLRDDDLTVKRVSWYPKTDSIRDAAAELNLGLDSFVFLDDSDFEIGLVRAQLPEVTTFQVPAKLYRYPALFRELETRFTQLSLSSEDLQRKRQYHEERMRTEERERHSDFESYLQGLGIKMMVSCNDPDTIPRIAQMTQKTNQFNLTTRRYTEADITAFTESDNTDVFAFAVQDNYGDSGITAACILHHTEACCDIDTLLMSCRIIGRNIEYAVMQSIVAHCASRGVETLNGMYIPTEKNMQVAEYYPRCGFTPSDTGEDGASGFTLQVSRYQPNELSYIEVIHA
ncbi:HAD-IIIC family phosphatase [bacterium]|nr:HAD-IIIC family phosphatase [bacterium]